MFLHSIVEVSRVTKKDSKLWGIKHETEKSKFVTAPWIVGHNLWNPQGPLTNGSETGMKEYAAAGWQNGEFFEN